jgi:hypothetical protein
VRSEIFITEIGHFFKFCKTLINHPHEFFASLLNNFNGFIKRLFLFVSYPGERTHLAFHHILGIIPQNRMPIISIIENCFMKTDHLFRYGRRIQGVSPLR